MSTCVCNGAILQCSYGTTMSQLQILQHKYMINNIPIASINDYKPMLNIQPFGMCSSISNPQVKAATMAAQGVLTPMPCIPNILSAWASHENKMSLYGINVLTDKCKLKCMWAGIIEIRNSGQDKVNII